MQKLLSSAVLPGLIGGVFGLAGGVATSYSSYLNGEAQFDIQYARLAVEMLENEALRDDPESRRFAVYLLMASTGVYLEMDEMEAWIAP